MHKIFLIAVVGCFAISAGAQSYFDVTKYGAKKNSSIKATKAIEKTITAAAAAGGGTVYFPAGKYLTGPIHLKSNITILIDAGAELHFSDDFDDYLPMVESRYEGVDVTSFSPLFYANGVENIAITGRGVIDGHGKKWWDFVEGYKEGQPRTKWQLEFDRRNKNILLPDDPRQMKRGFLRPPFIQFLHSKNILIEGIMIRNSPFWTINPGFCENVTVHAVTINNPGSNAPNTDGINPESCSNVHISDCHISVGDDCITIKSGKDIPGRSKNRPAENYTITNCTMLRGHGGVVIGSEMSGGVKKIAISNCIFDGTDRGIRIKTARGRGGVVEDIRVSNIVMKNIAEQAIVLDMEYAKGAEEPVSERTPTFRNIRLSNITAYTNQALLINGIREMPVSGISLNDVVFEARQGIVLKNAADISLNNVKIRIPAGTALKADQVERLDVNNFEATVPAGDAFVLQLNDVKGARIRNCWLPNDSAKFAAVTGAQTRQIIFKNNDGKNGQVFMGKEVNGAEVVKD
ncbi:glycoside hydrolase family 28 protein [Niabella soli]|uniref:Polygalacturonase n=1 Tax=Niabella soli DSM 19437 TaxID=929713 RepID=W0F1A7_9BACT|nr:glycoside hydrolase family 28 protein [Niabella soli]AHF16840.1 polygalacturonase [Niabella soli DSM 19437]